MTHIDKEALIAELKAKKIHTRPDSSREVLWYNDALYDAIDIIRAAKPVQVDVERAITHLNNALHALNLDRPDIAELRNGQILECNISTQRHIGEQIKAAITAILGNSAKAGEELPNEAIIAALEASLKFRDKIGIDNIQPDSLGGIPAEMVRVIYRAIKPYLAMSAGSDKGDALNIESAPASIASITKAEAKKLLEKIIAPWTFDGGGADGAADDAIEALRPFLNMKG